MATFDYDVAIIGSGFGGSVAALRAAEKGYRVGVMESGKRWADDDIPKMPLWPNSGDADTRPPLGSGYERVDPVMPHRPVVPAGAPAGLRLDATKDDVIPAYPY